MQQITIAECTRVLMLEFEQNGYSENTRREKSLTFGNIDRWFRKNGSIYYDCNLAREYEASVVAKFEAGVFAKTRRNSLLNGMRYISEYAETGTITLSKRRAPALLSDYFQGVLDLVLNNDQWTDAKRRNVGYAAHTYFRWLQQNGILTLSAVNDDVLRKYIIRCADCMTPGSLDTIRRNLKHVHGFLHELGIIEHNYADTLSFTTPAMHRIQKPIPADDIAEVLAAVDRSTSTGKRDFAMILLATVTGLRSVDIRKLAFSDIDWVNGEIRLVQSKTGNTLALPLTTDVGEAIQDYILNGRPASDLPNIFLSAKSPHIALHSHGLYNAFNKYREKLGRPVCAVHCLRRAVGTNMVVAGIPVTTVAQVLGHSRISATKQYISLDSAHLKQCALDFTGLPDRR